MGWWVQVPTRAIKSSYQPDKQSHGPQTTPQVHHTMKEVFVSSFTHNYVVGPITAPKQPSNLGIGLYTFQPLLKADNILLFCLCTKKMHKCSYTLSSSETDFISCVS